MNSIRIMKVRTLTARSPKRDSAGNKRQFAILCTLCVIATLRVNACVCSTEPIQKVIQSSIENSELIFTAKVTLLDTAKGYYTLKVLKAYKGKPSGELLVSSEVDSRGSISSCAFWPNLRWGDTYIVYANKVEGTNKIFISQCSATRSLSNPNIHLSYPANKLIDRKQRRQAKGDLKEEIRILEKLIAH